uniref:Uncharacterized protein n=1 Tax=Moniliophthora roreri TaxID=221103 RepID=A0A0W0FQF7_MONRR
MPNPHPDKFGPFFRAMSEAKISAGEGADPGSLGAKDGNKPAEKRSANHVGARFFTDA